MSEPIDLAQERVRRQAIDWLILTHSGVMSDDARRRFEAWRQADPAHAAAWNDAVRFWENFEALRGQPGLPGSRATANERQHRHRSDPALSSDVPELHPPVDAYGAAPPPAQARLRDSLPRIERVRRPRRWLRLVASFAGLAMAFSLLVNDHRWLADHATAVGETRAIVLADGSTLTLNTDSAVNVRIDPDRREVWLLSGEAAFKVAKDPAHPFIVHTEHGSARAIGTEFLVRETGDGFTVAVLEGSVKMETAEPASDSLLAAEQRGVFKRGGRLRLDTDGAVAALGAWRSGYVTFAATPLADALSEIDRYRPGLIVLTNPGLSSYRVSGVFPIDQLDQALQALAETTPARLSRLSPYLVFVH